MHNDEILERVREASQAYLSPREMNRVLRGLRFAFRSMGTDARYGRAEGERAYELCAEAGRKALRAAEMDPEQIDLLIYVGVGRGFLEPATANVFQDLLRLRAATCFDIMDACASWLRAIHVARSFLQSGTYSNVMILNAEFNANYENYTLRSVEEFDQRFAAFTIGEAATATIVSNSGEDDGYVTRFRSFGDQRDRCLIPLPNYAEYLAGDDQELEPYRFISHGQDIMEFGLDKLIEQYQKEPEFREFGPDIVFFHAASDGMARHCGVSEIAPAPLGVASQIHDFTRADPKDVAVAR